MNEIIDLSKHKILSIEIGSSCNLKKIHKKCPINSLDRNDTKQYMTIDQICNIIDDAKGLNFNGYVAFHFYNEPLIYIERIMKVIHRRPNEKYLLWSNGTLIKQIEKDGYALDVFKKIVLTCYDEKKMPQYVEVKKKYPDVEIGIADMDDRLVGYSSTYKNMISCKQIFFELPVDCYGEIFLCSHDWKNTYKIGNIKNNSFYDIITGDIYQNLLRISKKVSIHSSAPDICKSCRYARLTYHKGDNLLTK